MTTMSDRWKSAEQDLDRLLSALGVDSVDAAVARVEALTEGYQAGERAWHEIARIRESLNYGLMPYRILAAASDSASEAGKP